MRMPDALAPYASLIKWGLIALLSVGLFVSGCNHGENRGDEDREMLQDRITVLENANASWAQAAEDRNKIVDDNVKESERIQGVANKDAKDLAKEQTATERNVEQNTVKLQTALRDPKCSELLEMSVCPTVPLP